MCFYERCLSFRALRTMGKCTSRDLFTYDGFTSSVYKMGDKRTEVQCKNIPRAVELNHSYRNFIRAQLLKG